MVKGKKSAAGKKYINGSASVNVMNLPPHSGALRNSSVSWTASRMQTPTFQLALTRYPQVF